MAAAAERLAARRTDVAALERPARLSAGMGELRIWDRSLAVVRDRPMRWRTDREAALWLGPTARTPLPSLVDPFIITSSRRRGAVEAR